LTKLIALYLEHSELCIRLTDNIS